MGIQSLQSSGGVDWSKYANINKARNVNVPLANVFTPVLDITGEGFLTKAIVQGTGTTNKIRITIDGTIKYYGSINHTSYCCGVLLESSTSLNGTDGYLYTSYFASYIKLAGATAELSTIEQSESVLLGAPLFFKKSLLIEILTLRDNTSVGAHIIGGVK